MNLIQWLPIINVLGFIFLGIGYVIVQFKLGGRGVASEVINTYKDQVQQLRDENQALKVDSDNKIHDLKNSITALRLEMAKLQGVMQEKDKKIEELTTIFQGRDPGQLQYMDDMRKFTQGVAVYMKDSAEILNGIKDFMMTLNEKAVTNQIRNDKIDKATDQGSGKVLRKK